MIPWRAVAWGGWAALLAGLGLMVFGPFWVGLGLFAAGAAARIRAAAVPHHFPQHGGGERRGRDDDQ